MVRETAPQEDQMPDTVTAQILALQKMTVRELKVKWREFYGEDSRSCNRQFLWRRLAWRVQELAYGGLSERAKARIAELNRDDDLRMLPPRGWQPPSNGSGGQPAPKATPQPLVRRTRIHIGGKPGRLDPHHRADSQRTDETVAASWCRPRAWPARLLATQRRHRPGR